MKEDESLKESSENGKENDCKYVKYINVVI